jgi:hypothetical protein
MCQFFSFIDDGRRYLYADADKRKELLESNPYTLEPDSHASLAVMFDVDEDKCDKYEYNPITDVFEVDHLNRKRPRPESAEKWARELDFSSVVPELIVKPIVNPLEIKRGAPSPYEIQLLRQWGSVRDSVRDSLRDSVGARMRASVRANVWDSLGASVGGGREGSVWASVVDSVGDSLGASVVDGVWGGVWASVGGIVRDSIWARVGDSLGGSAVDGVWGGLGDSVRDSIWAYTGSFFRLEKWADGYPYRCAVDLWEAGLVPSFDGVTWRLHAGPNADVVYEE